MATVAPSDPADRRREKERLFFELFLEAMPALAGGHIDQPSPPEPDIVYTRGQSVGGVELTEVHGREAARREEGEQDEVLARAQRVYEDAGNPIVHAVAFWSSAFVADKSHRDRQAADLAEAVCSNVPAAGSWVAVDSDGDVQFAARYPFLARLRIERICDYQRGDLKWSASHSWWGSTADSVFLQHHISRKASRPAGYRVRYEEKWLLLTVRGSRPSSGFDIAPDALAAQYETTFERVFVLEVLGRSAHELSH